jgi:hypothetical protein
MRLKANKRPAHSQFSAGWSDTLCLLEREVAHLGGREFVLQVDVEEEDIRLDGQIRASARPKTPAVAVAFESKDGPLLFVCGRFSAWQDNTRAIALGLEALRRVDRYGITQSDEQYRGFRALICAVPMPAQMSLEDAARFLLEYGGGGFVVEDVIASRDVRNTLYRIAAKKLHPDVGGDGALFAKLTEARELLDESGMA